MSTTTELLEWPPALRSEGQETLATLIETAVQESTDLLNMLKIARGVIAGHSQSFLETVTNPKTGQIEDPAHALLAEADQDLLIGIDAAIAKAEGKLT